jgi:hypothetical protein
MFQKEPVDQRERVRHQIMFGNGLALLDANIRCLLLTHRCTRNIDFLDIKALYSSVRMLSIDPSVAYNPDAKVEAKFEV